MTTPPIVNPANAPALFLLNQFPLGTILSFFDLVGTTQSGRTWAVIK